MKSRIIIIALCCALIIQCDKKPEITFPSFVLTFTKEMSDSARDGRVYLFLAKSNTAEPRFQISADANTQLLFGLDVEGVKPNRC